MSDNCLHIVPIHEGDYPNPSQKANEILQWFLDRDIVENKLSDCTLRQSGYRFKPKIASLFIEGELWAYSETLKTHGLEITAGVERKVFHPMEGMYLIVHCSHCEKQVDTDLAFDWIGDWLLGQNSFQCPNCLNSNALVNYQIEPEWGFSNIGISLWNTHWELKPEIIKEFETIFEMPVIVLDVRI